MYRGVLRQKTRMRTVTTKTMIMKIVRPPTPADIPTISIMFDFSRVSKLHKIQHCIKLNCIKTDR